MTDRGTGRPAVWLRRLSRRVRERDFWVIQLGVVVAALLHVLVELAGLPQRHDLGAAVYVPPLLLVAPVAWASLRYGLEGGVLTGVWAAVLTVPNLLLWHPTGYEWLGDVIFLAVAIGLGVVVAVPVERERAERRQTEEVTARLHALERDRLRTYVREVTRAQEAERARIARELHDDVAQRLVVLVRHLDALGEGVSAASLGAAREAASEALSEVRRSSRDLRPTMLDDLGLGPAIEWLADDLADRNDVEVTATVEGGTRRLDAAVELALFRIAQEALRNVERHADASTARVELRFEDAQTRLLVRDDGRGFEVPADPASLARSGRLGMTGMRERAELVGGRLRVRAQEGEGTTVTAVVPLEPAT